MSTTSEFPESFNYVRGRDWADRVTAHLLADTRETVIAAIADVFGDPELRDRVARLIRDELSRRTRDVVEQAFAERAGG